MIKLIEIYEDDSYRQHKVRYKLREVFLNPEYITFMQCDLNYQQKLNRDLLAIEGGKKLNGMQKFTKISYLSGNSAEEIIVVAGVEELAARVNNGKSLLRG